MDQSQLDKFQLALPPHLSETDKTVLLQQLRNFPSARNFFGTSNDPEPLQGDAWHGLIAFQFPDGAREEVTGLVISNSCDLSAANKPDPDQSVLFAPLLDMSEYARVLSETGKPASYIDEWLDKIRHQEINRIFFVPNNGSFGSESFVLLDHVHSHPLSRLGGIRRIFSLSNYGWYVLLFKLSVHFTRMTEGVKRADLAV